MTNTGNLSNDGADDLEMDGAGPAGYGWPGGAVRLLSDMGPVANSGNVSANGGDGEFMGGGTADVVLAGTSVVNSGNVSARGGNANPAISGSRGGRGGFVELDSPAGVAGVTHSGTVDVAGGTGDNPDPFDAQAGSFLSGGVCVSSPRGCEQFLFIE